MTEAGGPGIERIERKARKRGQGKKPLMDGVITGIDGDDPRLRVELARAHAEIGHLTERLRQTEARLIQSSKLTGLGELSAGVAHELKQPLMVVKGLANNLLKDASLEERRSEKVRLIAEASSRMEEIINHLGVYARADHTGAELVDVNEVIGGAFLMLRDMLHVNSVSVVTDLRPLPVISGFPNRLEQVIINLSTNARDAMPRGGALTVETRRATTDRRAFAVITIRDSGHGIPEEVRARIFDAFYTTKPAGRGTGLGLSISRDIIREHSGEITCESAAGRGATFRVWLPAAAIA